MLRNSEPATVTAAFTHVVPADFAVTPGQLPPDVDYSAATGEITWLGPFEPEGEIDVRLAGRLARAPAAHRRAHRDALTSGVGTAHIEDRALLWAGTGPACE